MNRKSTFAYVDGILKNWKAKGFKSLEEIKEDSLIGLASKSQRESTISKEQQKLLEEIADYNWFEDDDDDDHS